MSFPDVQAHIVDAPLGAGPESILPIVIVDSGLALRAPRNDVSAIHAKAASVSAPATRGSKPASMALICNARYFELIRHCARLPAMNQRPGCSVRVYMLRSSWLSPNPQIGPTRSVTSSPN